MNFLKNLFRQHDAERYKKVVFLSGMGRSGTTWISNIINFKNDYRMMFEPFFPKRVKGVSNFNYIQFIDSDDQNASKYSNLKRGASKILSGEVSGEWVDQINRNQDSDLLLIKSVRANLMLKWLKSIQPEMKLVLTMRNPLAVAASWVKLGWGKDAEKTESDFKVIISQENLFKRYPLIKDALSIINKNDMFERIIFQWAVFHYVPFQQLKKDDFYLCAYEDFVTEPNKQIRSLFKYIDYDFDISDQSVLDKVINRSSTTNYLKRDVQADKKKMLEGWKKVFNEEQVAKANKILETLNLAHIYKKDNEPDLESVV